MSIELSASELSHRRDDSRNELVIDGWLAIIAAARRLVSLPRRRVNAEESVEARINAEWSPYVSADQQRGDVGLGPKPYDESPISRQMDDADVIDRVVLAYEPIVGTGAPEAFQLPFGLIDETPDIGAESPIVLFSDDGPTDLERPWTTRLISPTHRAASARQIQ